MKAFDRIRRNTIDALSLFVLPCVVALLPWRVGFASMKRAARRPWLYAASVDPSWDVARRHVGGLDEDEFKYQLRLLRLTDQVDSYLTLLRSARWWRRHVDVRGEWPVAAGPFLLLTSHWGAGGWVWKLLLGHGIRSHFLARRAEYSDMGLGRVALWYARFREWAVPRAGCAGVIFLGGSTSRIRAAFGQGDSVMGMIDLPAAAGQRAFEQRLGDATMRFRRGLVDLAVDARVPVVLVSCGLDAQSGRRELWIEALPVGTDADAIAARYAAHFGERLHRQPAYWQLWTLADALMLR